MITNAAPVHTNSIGNLVDTTSTRCDATGGHCARLHVVVQEIIGTQGDTWFRSFASITCTSASGDVPCAHLQGNTWLNCNRGTLLCIPDGTGQPNGGDTVDGPPINCSNCSVSGTVTPWYHHPSGNGQTYQGVGSFSFTTGAVGGGGPWGISAATVQFTIT